MAEGEEDARLKPIKAMIRSVLMSVKEGVPAGRFLSDYHGITGESIPYKEMGFRSLNDFIDHIPDVVHARMANGEMTFFAVADEATQHLQNLILRQKSNTKKGKMKKGSTRFPRHHSQMSRFNKPAGYATPPRPPQRQPFRPSGFHPTGFYPGGFTPRSFHPGSFHPGPFKPSPRPFADFGARGNRPPILKTPQSFESPPHPFVSPPQPAFSSSNLSPLMVTVKAGTGPRIIQRPRDGAGGKKMVSQALKAAMGQDRKSGPSNRGSYEIPPRFQKLSNGSSGDDRPVAVVQPNLPKDRDLPSKDSSAPDEPLPNNMRAWTAKVLEDFKTGLWSKRFEVMFKEHFGAPAPSNLIQTISKWTDIVKAELNELNNQHVLYPVSDEISPPAEMSRIPITPEILPTSTSTSVAETIRSYRVRSVEEPAPSQPAPKWQNYNVPIAELLEVGEMAYVYTSFSHSLSNFYVQREDSCADAITERLLEIHQDLTVPQPSDLVAGVFCAALYSEDSNWYRARVLFLHKNNQEVEVLFIDYGNRQTVAVSDVRCLTEETAQSPAQAIACMMFALKPLEGQQDWSDEAKTTFHNMMVNQRMQAHTYQISEGSCVVELWTEDEEGSINERLFNMGLVDTSLPRNMDPDELDLPPDGYVELLVAFVDLVHCWVRVSGPEYSEKLEMFEDSLAGLFKEAQRHTALPQVGSVCIGHPEDMLFHRVKVTELNDDKAFCFYVDHGYSEWHTIDQLAPLDTVVNQSLPYQAIQCLLSGLEKYMSNPVTVEELLKRTSQKICMAEIIASEPLTVMLYDTHGSDDVNINEEIARALVAAGHLIDMTQFSPSADTPSDTSSGSSPRPPPSIAPPPNPSEEELEAVTQRLTLADDATQTQSHSHGHSAPGSSSGVNDKSSVVRTAEEGIGDSKKDEQKTGVINSVNEAFGSRPTSAKSGDQVPESPGSLEVRPSLGGSASLPLATSPYSDTLCVAYNTWPLPSYTPRPEVGRFDSVFVYSIVDPSNFVIIPYMVLPQLQRMMKKLNLHFNAEMAAQQGGNPADVKNPTQVPEPMINHLYMVLWESHYYRAVFLKKTQSLLHIFLPDYCHHMLIGEEGLFFLPKTFWSLPFCAFKASLYDCPKDRKETDALGVKPAGNKERIWPEAAKFEFHRLAESQVLVAYVRSIRQDNGKPVADPDDQSFAAVSSQKLYLDLVITNDPEKDVLVSEYLLSAPYLRVVPDTEES